MNFAKSISMDGPAARRLKKARKAAALSFAGALAICALTAPAEPAHAKQCKPSAITSATFTRKYAWQAKDDAKDDWKKKAKTAWGSSWDNWLKAADKELICWGPNKQASCYAKARPCD